MTRRRGLVAVTAVVVVLSIGPGASADPIVISPTAVGEFVDMAPIDGAGLRFVPGAQNVALGPSAETRVFYEFSLAGARMTRGESAMFSVTRIQPFSECAALAPCPELNRIDIYGYMGDGAITIADYVAGTLLGRVTEIPLQGRSLTLDVTPFVSSFLSGDRAFAGIALRPNSQGGAGFEDARLSVVPEPSTLALVATAAVGYVGQRWRRRRLQNRPVTR